MKETESKMISELSTSLETDLSGTKSIDELKIALARYINDLINHDFDKLLRLLYKVDVSEKILRANLHPQEKDAGVVIAEMVIDRQLQKIETRRQFKSNNDIPENEKW
jgi:hypothetical protein